MNVVLTVRTLILSDNTLTRTIVIISFVYYRVADDSYSSSRRIRKDRPNYSIGILSANDNEDRKYKQVEENDEGVVDQFVASDSVRIVNSAALLLLTLRG